jgi:hypothetical protein
VFFTTEVDTWLETLTLKMDGVEILQRMFPAYWSL